MTRAKQVNKAIADASPLYRTILQKAYNGTAAPRSAIKAQCLACVGYERLMVTHCTGFTCPLWAYRPIKLKGVGYDANKKPPCDWNRWGPRKHRNP